ncbi:hypothetical protein CROQUDRAFT_337018 [Cronartium quercuum f. sp. fusiforme G11]|uniref:Uncharacterized protein n=1 Tax=Cronartium quercuum f. sp. fusiforme G11 TaxID=708437 RepID=A0A9P6N6R2_9BASI|nr:hypothetical protein CROQUDRAFT_337018 [Cronartium quercuum f. sp. fusiforme G11]
MCTVDVHPDVHPQQVTVVWTCTVTTEILPQLLSFSRILQPQSSYTHPPQPLPCHHNPSLSACALHASSYHFLIPMATRQETHIFSE